MQEEEPKPERRHLSRPNVLKQAIILAGSSEIACSIRNQHTDGAELRVAADASVPDRFFLDVPDDGVVYQTVVRWRRNERLGVQFYGAQEPRLK